MVHPLFKFIPVVADLDRMKGDINENKPESASVLSSKSKRQRILEKEKVIEEDPLWQGNPFWLVNIWYYLRWLVIGVILTIGIRFLWMLLRSNETVSEDYLLDAILGSAGFWLIILIACSWRFLDTKLTHYTVTETKFIVATGLLLRRPRRAFINRITDYSPTISIWQRLCGRSSMKIETSDRDMSEVELRWIAGGDQLVALLDHIVHEQTLRFPIGQINQSNQESGGHHGLIS